MDERPFRVVATLGPATATPSAARELVEAGAAALRLNTSHLSPADVARRLDDLGPAAGETPVYLDLQGAKWRVGPIEPLDLGAGATVELVLGRAPRPRAAATPARVPVPHEDFFRAAAASDGRVLLDDARLELAVEAVEADRAVARVVRPGRLGPRKGITVPATSFRCEALTAADAEVLAAAAGRPGVRYAVSFVKDGEEARRFRSLLGAGTYLAAKLERASAVADARAVGRVADELWLCRGDLGAEMGLPAMAAAVHELTLTVASIERPTLMAGQVLEHMSTFAEPTRSEVCHLYDLRAAGYAGVVLSDETAIGRRPAAAVRVACSYPPSSTHRLR